MSKRIVVGLDGSAHSRSALDIALRRARDYGATIIGVAVIDQPRIEQIETGAQPGGMQLASKSVSLLVNAAKERAETLIAEFRTVCDAERISHEDVIYNGTPVVAIMDEGKTADLVIVGMVTNFYGAPGSHSDHTFADLLKKPTCPVMGVPAQAQLPRNIIIAYDGSPGAARALQAYVHVTPNLKAGYPVTLLCVAEDYEKHKYHLEKAAMYLKAHGVQPHVLVRSGKPAEAIRGVAREQAPSLVILGAPLHKSLAERIFGSVTEAIIKDGTIPVFVFH